MLMLNPYVAALWLAEFDGCYEHRHQKHILLRLWIMEK